MTRIATLIVLLAFSWSASAAYPEKPIRLILGSAAGGSVDVLMRILAQQLSTQMNVQFVIENKPGASFVPATMDVVKAPPDGYTLGYGNIVSLAINRALLPKLPYDVERDLTLVSNCVQVFNMLAVNNDLPVRTVQELVAYAKKNPGKLSFGSPGIGSTGHLSTELFKSLAGIDMVHVAYKGSAPTLQDLMGGQVQVVIDNIPPYLPHVKAGKIRALAVTPGRRSPAIPDLPTMAEAGVKGYEASTWFALFAPADTPQEIVDKLSEETRRILALPDVREKLLSLGAQPSGSTPQELARFVESEIAKWGRVIRSANVTLQ